MRATKTASVAETKTILSTELQSRRAKFAGSASSGEVITHPLGRKAKASAEARKNQRLLLSYPREVLVHRFLQAPYQELPRRYQQRPPPAHWAESFVPPKARLAQQQLAAPALDRLFVKEFFFRNKAVSTKAATRPMRLIQERHSGGRPSAAVASLADKGQNKVLTPTELFSIAPGA